MLISNRTYIIGGRMIFPSNEWKVWARETEDVFLSWSVTFLLSAQKRIERYSCPLDLAHSSMFVLLSPLQYKLYAASIFTHIFTVTVILPELPEFRRNWPISFPFVLPAGEDRRIRPEQYELEQQFLHKSENCSRLRLFFIPVAILFQSVPTPPAAVVSSYRISIARG